MNDIREILEKIKSTNEIVSIHYDPFNMSSCSVGLVEAIDENFVRLKALSTHGQDAGYEVRRINEIFKIEIGGYYEKKIAFLNNNIGKVFSEKQLGLPYNEETILMGCLKQAMIHHLIVVVWCEDSEDSIIGYVKQIAKDSICFLSIDDYGKPDGEIFLKKSSIKYMDCNSTKAQVILFLNEKKFYDE